MPLPMTAHLPVSAQNRGRFAATLPGMEGLFQGAYLGPGTFAATLPVIQASFSGAYLGSGSFAASLPKLDGSFTGDQVDTTGPTYTIGFTLDDSYESSVYYGETFYEGRIHGTCSDPESGVSSARLDFYNRYIWAYSGNPDSFTPYDSWHTRYGRITIYLGPAEGSSPLSGFQTYASVPGDGTWSLPIGFYREGTYPFSYSTYQIRQKFVVTFINNDGYSAGGTFYLELKTQNLGTGEPESYSTPSPTNY